MDPATKPFLRRLARDLKRGVVDQDHLFGIIKKTLQRHAATPQSIGLSWPKLKAYRREGRLAFAARTVRKLRKRLANLPMGMAEYADGELGMVKKALRRERVNPTAIGSTSGELRSFWRAICLGMAREFLRDIRRKPSNRLFDVIYVELRRAGTTYKTIGTTKAELMALTASCSD